MAKTLGIINIEPNYVHVEGIEDYRPIHAASILGRYRLIDFILSNFTNSGIYNVDVQVKSRPRSTIQHVHRTNYNINTKKGKIRILHGERPVLNEVYNTDVASLIANAEFFEESNASYVILAPSHFLYVQDFNPLIEHHIRSKNDITVLYQNTTKADTEFLMCDTIDFNSNKRVYTMDKNRGRHKKEMISLETYILSKDLLLELIASANEISSLYFFSDIVKESLDRYKVGAYPHKGPAFCISSLLAYYQASMEIKKEKELSKFINDSWPIYTATNDTCPTLYTADAEISSSIVGNGCRIEGKVINSVIGRNVTIRKGAVIKDCVIMPDALINKNVKMEHCVVDRLATITHVKELSGKPHAPLYVKRRDRI